MLKVQLQNDLKTAMKAVDISRRTVLQSLLAAIRNKEIEKRSRIKEVAGKSDEELRTLSELKDDEIISVIAAEVKKRKDALTLYEKSGRLDLIEKEKSELEILSAYLPEQLSEEEIRIEVKKIIETLKAGPGDFGKAMKEVSARLKGKAEGGLVSKIVKEMLG
ncbi:MAG: GatB/YqeY domain-containing protein [Parcubacteria group bacterium]|nr:GatB/YqeY domain-containing protein [Parcubacteria group bacterium]